SSDLGEHVGWLVLAAISQIEGSNTLIGAQGDRGFGRVELQPSSYRICNRAEHLIDGREGAPVTVFDDDIELQPSWRLRVIIAAIGRRLGDHGLKCLVHVVRAWLRQPGPDHKPRRSVRPDPAAPRPRT